MKKNGPLSFDVTVKDKGTYKLYADMESRRLFLQSPVSGMFRYEYDSRNKHWKSDGQEHIIEDLLVREFLMVTNGMLSLWLIALFS